MDSQEMPELTVKLGRRAYPILIEPGSMERIGLMSRRVLGSTARSMVVISNPTVNAIYGLKVKRSLSREGFAVKTFLIGDGERHKTLKTAERVYSFLIEEGIERSDAICALGGGVVGDLAGFVAATYLRGVRLIHAPTTLLAQIDSSIGGKTGVNHRVGKNLIGAFHQPAAVLADPETIKTLPVRQLRSGLFEALKYGVIRDRRFFFWMFDRLDSLGAFDLESLTKLIVRCCEIKARIVEKDEREGDLRIILNFGHTIGHAIEAATAYRRFHHGEAVGLGMRCAARIAGKVGILSPGDLSSIENAISSTGRIPRANSLAPDDIISLMHHDKKASAGKINLVLPIEIGQVVVSSDVPLRIIRETLREILAG